MNERGPIIIHLAEPFAWSHDGEQQSVDDLLSRAWEVLDAEGFPEVMGERYACLTLTRLDGLRLRHERSDAADDESKLSTLRRMLHGAGVRVVIAEDPPKSERPGVVALELALQPGETVMLALDGDRVRVGASCPSRRDRATREAIVVAYDAGVITLKEATAKIAALGEPRAESSRCAEGPDLTRDVRAVLAAVRSDA